MADLSSLQLEADNQEHNLRGRFSNGKFSPNVIWTSQTLVVFLRNSSTISDLENLFWAIRSVNYIFKFRPI